jgi:predicted N-acyltransferase
MPGSGYNVHVIEDTNVLPSEWDILSVGRAFSSIQWLQFMRAILNEFHPYYLLLYDKDQLVGRAIVTRNTTPPGISFTSAWPRRILHTLLRRWPLLVMQSPGANLSGIVLPAGDEAAAMLAISRTLDDLARRSQASFTVLGWINQREYDLIQPTGAYTFTQLDQGTVLPLTWSSFDQYITSLSASARQDFRRHRKKADERQIRIERVSKFSTRIGSGNL